MGRCAHGHSLSHGSRKVSCDTVPVCPFLPGINNTIENHAGLLDYCRQVNVKGILNFGIGLTLRNGNREYFYKQLDKSFPGKKQQFQKIFGNSYIVNSSNNNELMEYFTNFCKANKIDDIDSFVDKCLLQGFNVIKYGLSPQDNFKKENEISNFASVVDKSEEKVVSERYLNEDYAKPTNQPKKKIKIIKN